MPKYSKETFIQLRKEGKSYSEISKIMGCSKSTVSFHCQDLDGNDLLIKENRDRRRFVPVMDATLLPPCRKKNINYGEATIAAQNSTCYRELAEKLGTSETSSRRLVKKLNLDVKHFSYGRWYKYTYEVLAPIVAKCTSVAQVLRRLDLRPWGNNYKNLKLNITRLNIDISHFKGCGWNKDLFKPLGLRAGSTTIRDHVFRQREHKCEVCGLFEWCGEPINLEIHHINGVNCDNRLENLQIICPNCHSQTDNFRNKKRKTTFPGAWGEAPLILVHPIL